MSDNEEGTIIKLTDHTHSFIARGITGNKIKGLGGFELEGNRSDR